MFLHDLLKRTAVRQFIKYFVVGCFITGIDMAILHILYHVIHLPFKISVAIGFMSGNISGFFLNKYFTFHNRSKAILHQYMKYFATSMTGLLWTILLMTLFYEYLGLFSGISTYNYLICKMIVSLIVVFWNFTIIRHWNFKSLEVK